jgi:hypothetical protein
VSKELSIKLEVQRHLCSSASQVLLQQLLIARVNLHSAGAVLKPAVGCKLLEISCSMHSALSHQFR